jgi:hypothetical protein
MCVCVCVCQWKKTNLSNPSCHLGDHENSYYASLYPPSIYSFPPWLGLTPDASSSQWYTVAGHSGTMAPISQTVGICIITVISQNGRVDSCA